MQTIRQIGEDMPGGFLVYRADEQEEILYVNDVTLDIFGCEDREQFRLLTGNTFQGLVLPEDLEGVQRSISKQVRESKRKLDYVEYRIRRLDGEIRYVEDFGRFSETEEYGDVFFVMLWDVTEIRAEREESLRRAEVIEGLSGEYSSIFLLNLENSTIRTYRLNNNYFREIAGESEEHVLDMVMPRYAERFVIEEDREAFLVETKKNRIKVRLKKEDSYSFRYRLSLEKGVISYMEMSVVGIKRDDSIRAVLGFRDVTEQTLKLQRELGEKLNIELELEKQKRSNEIKSAFLFNVSHDIRTPMNTIKGYTELALSHLQEPEKLSDYLSRVQASNIHLLSLIDDLLEVSGLDYGRFQLKEENCDLKENLEILFSVFGPRMEEKGLTLETKLELPPERVLMDAPRFRRVLSSLLDNALRFTPEGGKITVKAQGTADTFAGIGRYKFVVEDTGIGMSEEFMKRMYEAFEKEENSTKSGYLGAGLGLTIAKQFLDAMGGSIIASSKKGEGTTFFIGLPIKLADEKKEGDGMGSAAPEMLQKSEDIRILLVEDVELNRMMVEELLEEAGYLVESCADGAEAVQTVKEHPVWYYDLVLMDIQMPVMNGYEATKAIRAMGRVDTDLLPIIALSANDREEDRKLSMENGMTSHLAKPFDIAKLEAMINLHVMNNRDD